MSRCMHEVASPTSEEGFALPAALAVVLSVTILTMALSLSMRSQMQLASRLITSSKAEEIADEQVWLALANLVANPEKIQKQTNCAWKTTARVQVSLQDQGGLVDINHATPQLILALLTGIGVDSSRAQKISDDWVRFRQQRNFLTTEELHLLSAFNLDELKTLANLTTIYSGSNGMDPTEAPDVLLRALQAASKDALLNYSYPTAKKAYSVEVKVMLGTGGGFKRRAVVKLTGYPEHPIYILAWDAPVAGQPANHEPLQTLPPCAIAANN
jgi:hypothetical protein